jgi:hypothetical protein
MTAPLKIIDNLLCSVACLDSLQRQRLTWLVEGSVFARHLGSYCFFEEKTGKARASGSLMSEESFLELKKIVPDLLPMRLHFERLAWGLPADCRNVYADLLQKTMSIDLVIEESGIWEKVFYNIFGSFSPQNEQASNFRQPTSTDF